MTLLSESTFLPGDYRNELKGWIRRNCLETGFQWIKRKSSAFYRVTEDLSLELARRKKHGLSLSLVEQEVKGCGRSGECQEHKDTKETRFVGHYCNQRAFHIPCAIRYRAGQGVELKNQYLEIAKANDLWGFYSWTFTLPDTVRAWIDKNPESAKDFLQDVRRGISRTIKACLGVNTKARNMQPGFSIMYHPSSSGDPFKQSAHFHVIALPLLADLKNKTLSIFGKRFDHARVKRLYKENLDRVLMQRRLEGLIRDQYTVHLYDVELAHESSVHHSFRYNNRSQAEDVLKRIKRVTVDLGHYLCVLVDKERNLLVPVLKSRHEVLDALERAMNPVIQVRMSYGFMRVIERYSKLLNIERDEYHDDENWVTLYYVEMLRMMRSRYDKGLGKVITVFEVWVRRKDSQEDFVKLKPDEVRGERSCMSNRKLFKAKGGIK